MTRHRPLRPAAAPRALFASVSALALLLPVAALPLAAQEDRFPGVELRMVYEAYTPSLAVQPFMGRFGGAPVAPLVEAIVARDLRYSDRFQMADSIPRTLAGETVDYNLWDRLGTTWLLTGRVEGAGGGNVLILELHDVPFAQVKERGTFDLPSPDDPGFRMAVHRASDQVVQWALGEPGMAASRIVFAMRREDSLNKELWIVDSDGENLQRITHHDALVMSPAWSPDGNRIVYATSARRPWELFQLDLATRRSTPLDIDRTGMLMTPAFAPDGEHIAFSVRGGSRSGIYTYDLARECCLTNLTEGPRVDTSPTYSPDGRWIAFNSNRLGEAVPQIYLMPAAGGEAELVSPYAYGAQGYYTSPDWSPRGDHVAFHGKLGRTGRFHILVAPVEDRGGRVLQLTYEGNNEDPSWAPDGRHLVFKGERNWGKGLFVVDTATGTIRVLLRGVEVTTPQWSPAL